MGMTFAEYQQQYPDLEKVDVVQVWVSDMLENSFALNAADIVRQSGLSRKVVDRIVRELKEQHRKQPDPLVQKQVLSQEVAVMTYIRINRGFVREDQLQRITSLEMIDRLVDERKILSWGSGYYSLPSKDPPVKIQRQFKKMILAEVDSTPIRRVTMWIERRPPGTAWTKDDMAIDVGLPRRTVSRLVAKLVEEGKVNLVERVGLHDFYRKAQE
jgi:CRP-like cAMP-binding protein